MGDNGAPLKIHKTDSPLKGDPGGWDGSLNAPLNGEKGMLSEGGIRVPWLAYWKGTIPGRQVYKYPVISLDVAATVAALAGIDLGPGELDGVDLLPYFTGRNTSAPHDVLFWRWVAQSAVREGRWKLLLGAQRSYLFDLETDTEEKTNLIARHPEVARRLRDKLDAWSKELQPPGIDIQPMARTWENCFDFYLDAKPAAELDSAGRGTSVNEWIVRNAQAETLPGALLVRPDKSGKQRPFIACTDISIPGPVTATISLRSATGGNAGFAWRLAGQQDFPPDQNAVFDLSASTDWQDKSLELPAAGTVIHLRILLPPGITEIRRVSLTSTKNQSSRQWNFDSRK